MYDYRKLCIHSFFLEILLYLYQIQLQIHGMYLYESRKEGGEGWGGKNSSIHNFISMKYRQVNESIILLNRNIIV